MNHETDDMMLREHEVNDECGVFAIYDRDGHNPASLAYYALYALQHRGQESCGIAVNVGGEIICYKDLGLVPDVFSELVLNHLSGGGMGIGHVRYSTSGDKGRENSQPLVSKYVKGTISIAFNGNLMNKDELRRDLEKTGAIFQTDSDTEVILYIIARERLKQPSIEAAITQAMKKLRGAYSMVLMSPRKLIAVRDPVGFRPLCMGRLGDSVVFASETCALDALGAEFVRDLRPGEVVVISPEGEKCITDNCTDKARVCIFEYVYFARPDSIIEGASVHFARQEAGRYLAKEHPVEADIVLGVPDSGLDAALGYAAQSGIPYAMGFIKNRYVGRTFIQPTQGQREMWVGIKLGVLRAAVEGKRVIMVEDSVVRGTTMGIVVQRLKNAGAKEVHIRIASPPVLNPCYFGTDITSRSELLANNILIEEIRRRTGADTLGYLSIESLRKIPLGAACGFCDGCFTGDYPLDVSQYDPDKLIQIEPNSLVFDRDQNKVHIKKGV